MDPLLDRHHLVTRKCPRQHILENQFKGLALGLLRTLLQFPLEILHLSAQRGVLLLRLFVLEEMLIVRLLFSGDADGIRLFLHAAGDVEFQRCLLFFERPLPLAQVELGLLGLLELPLQFSDPLRIGPAFVGQIRLGLLAGLGRDRGTLGGDASLDPLPHAILHLLVHFALGLLQRDLLLGEFLGLLFEGGLLGVNLALKFLSDAAFDLGGHRLGDLDLGLALGALDRVRGVVHAGRDCNARANHPPRRARQECGILDKRRCAGTWRFLCR